jgi:aspartate aminotransferase-like enzyme
MAVSLNWGRCMTRATLMIPGPTELPYPVIQALNQPPAIQYDPTLGALELALRDLGYKCETGAGVAAAQTVFADAT